MDFLAIESGQEFNTLSKRLGNWDGYLCSFALDSIGRTVDVHGTSSGLSSNFDLQLLLVLRSKADCIVTTGATARAENYKASRFAPIAFLTRNPDSLLSLPAFTEPSGFANIVLTNYSDENVFIQIKNDLAEKGHRNLLFEGGASSLQALIAQNESVKLITSISNLESASSLDLDLMMRGFLGEKYLTSVTDDFATESNRVTTWLVGLSRTDR